jgi:phosphatidylserine/phosphatidylglycerophosphate/cardiolipin synthase-like enzyme
MTLEARIARIVSELSLDHVQVFGRCLDRTPRLADLTPAMLGLDIPDPASVRRFTELVNDSAATAYTPAALALALRSAAQTFGDRDADGRVEVVWTGPDSATFPSRQTAAVLFETLKSARETLLLLSYAANDIGDVTEALTSKAADGVEIRCVLESSEESENFKQSQKSLIALAKQLPLIRFYTWPKERRPKPWSSLHAKVVIADRRTAFVTSANLTESAITDNVELGLILRGGDAPACIHDHVTALIEAGEFVPIA